MDDEVSDVETSSVFLPFERASSPHELVVQIIGRRPTWLVAPKRPDAMAFPALGGAICGKSRRRVEPLLNPSPTATYVLPKIRCHGERMHLLRVHIGCHVTHVRLTLPVC